LSGLRRRIIPESRDPEGRRISIFHRQVHFGTRAPDKQVRQRLRHTSPTRTVPPAILANTIDSRHSSPYCVVSDTGAS
jgi:hypothetical protein